MRNPGWGGVPIHLMVRRHPAHGPVRGSGTTRDIAPRTLSECEEAEREHQDAEQGLHAGKSRPVNVGLK